MDDERQLIRLGRREGVAGTSRAWEVRQHGRIRRTDRNGLRQGLLSGRLTGIESVRRTDGDWGPLFGRPIYREVFAGTHEPRDHAKARARDRVARLQRWSWGALGVAGTTFLVSLPVWGLSWLVEVGLLATLAAGIGAGWLRLLAAVQQAELDQLVEQLVPPVLPPPEPVDWEKAVAEDAARRAETDGSDGRAP
jgi:hypothetical protein